MQFEALKVFCDVARFRSFSQAAAANRLSQPAASQIVREIERRLGVQLVDRSTRPLQLTPEGQTYYDGCRGLVEQYLEIEEAVRRSKVEVPSNVQVAAIYSIELRDMNQYIERFAAQVPGASAHIEYLHPDRVYEKVLEGTVDLGLVSFPKKSRELTTLQWREEEMVIACAPGHPFARRRSVKIADLENERFVAFERGLAIRKRIDRFLRDQGVAVETVLEFDNIENIKNAVEVSGLTLLPLPTVEREVRVGTLVAVRISDAKMVRPLVIIHRRRERLSSPVRRFVELLRQPDEAGRRPEDAGADTLARTVP